MSARSRRRKTRNNRRKSTLMAPTVRYARAAGWRAPRPRRRMTDRDRGPGLRGVDFPIARPLPSPRPPTGVASAACHRPPRHRRSLVILTTDRPAMRLGRWAAAERTHRRAPRRHRRGRLRGGPSDRGRQPSAGNHRRHRSRPPPRGACRRSSFAKAARRGGSGISAPGSLTRSPSTRSTISAAAARRPAGS